MLERALHYGIQVVDAVAHAYDQTVVHGELKSSSIMVAPDGAFRSSTSVLPAAVPSRLAEHRPKLTRSVEGGADGDGKLTILSVYADVACCQADERS